MTGDKMTNDRVTKEYKALERFIPSAFHSVTSVIYHPVSLSITSLIRVGELTPMQLGQG